MNTSRSMHQRAQGSRLLAYGATGLTLSITGCGIGTALLGDPPASAFMQQGLSMVTAYDRNDARSPRIRRYLPRFRQVAAPRPEAGDWQSWVELMASRETDADAGPGGAMTVVMASGFGTAVRRRAAWRAAVRRRRRLNL